MGHTAVHAQVGDLHSRVGHHGIGHLAGEVFDLPGDGNDLEVIAPLGHGARAGRWVARMTMRWRKMLTVPTNQLIHTRTWNDVVDVEIATFQRVT